MGQAKDLYAKQMKELDAITSTRQMQEARLLMSVEANYSLLKKGIAMDIMSIEETVDALKSLEEEYVKQMLSVDDLEQTAGECCRLSGLQRGTGDAWQCTGSILSADTGSGGNDPAPGERRGGKGICHI